jgi:hypothetical protein
MMANNISILYPSNNLNIIFITHCTWFLEFQRWQNVHLYVCDPLMHRSSLNNPWPKALVLLSIMTKTDLL